MPDGHSQKTQLTLNILATSDVHGALGAGRNGSAAKGGLGKIASLVASLRAEHPNCLLVDNGDFLQGTPLCDLVASGQLPLSDGHPVIRAMNHLKYDAVGLGNHEFDYGLPFLKDTLDQAEFPVIGSNAACEGQNWLKKLIIEEDLVDDNGHQHRLKIGVLSVLPEQVTAWNAAHLKDRLSTRDITETAIETAATLRQEGAQIVVALLHSGIGGEDREPRQENAVIPIAKAAEIDAIICGHTHQMLPDADRSDTGDVDFATGHIAGIPSVMPGCNGSHLGHITLQLEISDDEIAVTSSGSQLHPTLPNKSGNHLDEDPEIAQIAQASEIACSLFLNEIVGETKTPLHSFYAHLPGDPSVACVAQAQLDFAEPELKGHLPKDVAVISAASAFKAGGRGGSDNYASVPSGPMTRWDLTQLHPFQNTVVALEITGAQLKEWLEMSASSFNQVVPDVIEAELKRPDFPCYGFDVVFGVTYAIDLTQPAKYDVLGKVVENTNRIVDLCYHGTPVSDDQAFVMLTTSYRAGGGGNFPSVQNCRHVDIPSKDSRELLADFIASNPTSDQIPPSPWRFKPIQDAKVTRMIGQGVLPYFAQGHRPEIEITAGQVDPSGFVPFTINLDS